MTPKLERIREEKEKNAQKIQTLQARNRKLEADITALENADIISMVRESHLAPDELCRLLQTMKRNSEEGGNTAYEG